MNPPRSSLTVAEQLQEQMANLDLIAISLIPSAEGFADNVNVVSNPIVIAELPTEAEYSKI